MAAMDPVERADRHYHGRGTGLCCVFGCCHPLASRGAHRAA